MACAVGGSRHPTLDCAIAALGPFSGPPQATVLGRRERLDALHTALMNGISSPGKYFKLGVALSLYSGMPYSETTGTDAYNHGMANARGWRTRGLQVCPATACKALAMPM